MLREVLAIFGVSISVITVLFLSQRIIQVMEGAVNRGVGFFHMGRLMIYILPTVLLIVFPIVTLFSILLGIGRMSSDNEITALKASGVGLFRLFPPVLIFAALAASMALYVSQTLSPEAAHARRMLEWKIMRTRTDAAVTDRIFVDLVDDTTFYVREKADDGELRGIMAAREDRPDSGAWKTRQFIFASSGRFVHDPDTLENELWLSEGTMVQEDRKSGREDYLIFEKARIRLGMEKESTNREERRHELDFYETVQLLQSDKPLHKKPEVAREERMKIQLQFHERMAWPLGCLALCFWAVPLGIQPVRAGRSRSIVVAVVLSAVFYYLMIIARFAADSGWASPGVAMWAPDIVITVTGIYMLRQKNNERPIFVLSRAEDYLYHISSLIRERFKKGRE